MKVFERFEEVKFDYPEDMKVIMDYLNQHGKLNVQAKTVENLYKDFSDDKYCAGWMGVMHHGEIKYWLLEEFADYLSEINL